MDEKNKLRVLLCFIVCLGLIPVILTAVTETKIKAAADAAKKENQIDINNYYLTSGRYVFFLNQFEVLTILLAFVTAMVLIKSTLWLVTTFACFACVCLYSYCHKDYLSFPGSKAFVYVGSFYYSFLSIIALCQYVAAMKGTCPSCFYKDSDTEAGDQGIN